jgi:hypothetical protein
LETRRLPSVKYNKTDVPNSSILQLVHRPIEQSRIHIEHAFPPQFLGPFQNESQSIWYGWKRAAKVHKHKKNWQFLSKIEENIAKKRVFGNHTSIYGSRTFWTILAGFSGSNSVISFSMLPQACLT